MRELRIYVEKRKSQNDKFVNRMKQVETEAPKALNLLSRLSPICYILK